MIIRGERMAILEHRGAGWRSRMRRMILIEGASRTVGNPRETIAAVAKTQSAMIEVVTRSRIDDRMRAMMTAARIHNAFSRMTGREIDGSIVANPLRGHIGPQRSLPYTLRRMDIAALISNAPRRGMLDMLRLRLLHHLRPPQHLPPSHRHLRRLPRSPRWTDTSLRLTTPSWTSAKSPPKAM